MKTYSHENVFLDILIIILEYDSLAVLEYFRKNMLGDEVVKFKYYE